MDDVLSNYGFDNLGEFLATLFHRHIHGQPDPRTPRHTATVSAFLQGSTSTNMGDIIELIYQHSQSRPKKKHPEQRAAAFSHDKPLNEISFARPCLSAWATRLVGDETYYRLSRMAKKKSNASGSDRRHLRATANSRNKNARVITWADTEFSIQGLADQYRKKDGLIWYLTECMAGRRKNGVVVVRQRRPHPVIQVAAISCSFIVSRNQYATGDLALPLAIWHFAVKSHVDVKRVYSRFGSIVSDPTARNAINSMTASSLAALQDSVHDATARSEVEWGKILDNVQEYSPVYEHGLGRENQLKVGTACTAFRYDDCKPGAWRAADHITRVIGWDRTKMTVESINQSIDWDHIDNVTDLHLARVLVEFCPHLQHLSTEISARFRTAPITKHRLRLCRKVLQGLGTNSEREVENEGMKNARNGASHATIMRLKKILITEPGIYDSFRNVISTPETWHTKATDLNSCASNHYSPAASKEPSSLSRSSNAANMKRPTDLKKCDFYSTSRSMTLIWGARVLDCWRLILGIDNDSNILTHFEELAERYASQAAHGQSLSKAEQEDTSPQEQVPTGSPWAKPSSEDGPKAHTEPPGFDGDRVLSNAILFLMEFAWWTELNYAITEGDVGRVMEILKILIFTFAGTSNQNYMGYLLDLHALLEFEYSPELKEAILNNWLLNLAGEVGRWIEADLMQEHYNKWLEDMVKRCGGNFDDKFYRQTLAPNVQHFLKIKEDIESAFDLKRRSKSHTSPHLRDETHLLLRMYKEDQLHLFRSGCSMGHAAVNRFDRGYQRLEGGKLGEFLEHSQEYTDLVRDIETVRNGSKSTELVDADRGLAAAAPDTPRAPSRTLPAAMSPHPSRPPSVATAIRRAADCVEQWDDVDHSDEPLFSGSDLAVAVDAETGRMSADWYEAEEFEEDEEPASEGESESDEDEAEGEEEGETK
ncbi:hypothetical protein B0H16DRAFT_1667975 [Mycena metata]|uniref:DUF6589 domain-containing protein n=1 Tax=Mycena metata TaxID=1033252 RepID=A0AAD7GZL9_9AGAR|nr:hypothetical protein B0H16DRAFT_1667975 [Mycena metata]